jgi:hypothetical protein
MVMEKNASRKRFTKNARQQKGMCPDLECFEGSNIGFGLSDIE